MPDLTNGVEFYHGLKFYLLIGAYISVIGLLAVATIREIIKHNRLMEELEADNVETETIRNEAQRKFGSVAHSESDALQMLLNEELRSISANIRSGSPVDTGRYAAIMREHKNAVVDEAESSSSFEIIVPEGHHEALV